MHFKQAVATLAIASIGGVDAFFRINCAKIQVGRIDPIVNPGAIAAHCHTIVGGSSENMLLDMLYHTFC
jgi:imidazolonepropionase-like amidohydrolase